MLIKRHYLLLWVSVVAVKEYSTNILVTVFTCLTIMTLKVDLQNKFFSLLDGLKIATTHDDYMI